VPGVDDPAATDDLRPGRWRRRLGLTKPLAPDETASKIPEHLLPRSRSFPPTGDAPRVLMRHPRAETCLPTACELDARWDTTVFPLSNGVRLRSFGYGNAPHRLPPSIHARLFRAPPRFPIRHGKPS
jgi:hypothetical protein